MPMLHRNPTNGDLRLAGGAADVRGHLAKLENGAKAPSDGAMSTERLGATRWREQNSLILTPRLLERTNAGRGR
jgi:hypothetical protein